MIWATYSFFKSIYSISIYCQPAKLNQFTVNLQKIMIFSVSNDPIQWTLDFGPDSVSITVKDLDQNITISSQKRPLAAWHVLLSQRQDFLDNHLPRVANPQKQEETMEMKEELLCRGGLKTWTLAAIKCPISKTLNSVGKSLQWIWKVFIDLELIPCFPPPYSTIFVWK